MEAKLINPVYAVHLDEQELSILGRFLVSWGQLDFLVKNLICEIIKTDLFYGEFVFKNITSGALFTLFQDLGKTIDDKDFKLMAKKFSASALQILDKRNHIVHGVWGLEVAPESSSLLKAAYHKKNEQKPIYIGEISDICNKISLLTHDCMRLRHRLAEIGHAPSFPYLDSSYDPSKPQPTFMFGKGPPP
jgi:hypothetical protein